MTGESTVDWSSAHPFENLYIMSVGWGDPELVPLVGVVDKSGCKLFLEASDNLQQVRSHGNQHLKENSARQVWLRAHKKVTSYNGVRPSA
eukprot:1138791-Pelagomonas_calceolata.AAC.1